MENKNAEQNRFFETARPMRLFLIVALPGLVSMLAMSLYQAFEGGFVGQILGDVALAAINLAMPLVMINFSLADLIGVGSAVHISVALGRGDNKRANNIFTCSVIMIFLMGILTGVLMFFSAPAMLNLVAGKEYQNAEFVLLAVKYVRTYAILSPVTTLVFAMDNYLRISGFVKGSMFLNIGMSLVTIVFLAIYLIAADMDVAGSALASCSAMIIAAVVAMIPFVRCKAVLKFCRPRPSLKMIGQIASSGTPIFLNNVAGRVTSFVMNASLISLGGPIAVTAYSVLMYAGGIVEPMLYGMSDAVQPAVGYNWGAKRLDRVRDITKCSFIVCGIVSLLSTAVMIFFPELLASIFVEAENTELMQLSVDAMRLFGTAFIFGWFGFAVQGFFCAIEKPLPATILSISRALIFPVALIFALRFMGLDGLWLNYTGTAILTAIMSVIMLIITQRHMRNDISMEKSDKYDY